MRRFVLFVLLLSQTARLDAQIGRRRVSTAPTTAGWAGASLDFNQPFYVLDGSTNSTWYFGSSTPVRLSLEVPAAPTVAVGISAIGAVIPLEFSSLADGSCGSCDATAKVRQLMVTARRGGTSGAFSTILQVGVGGTGFSDFKPDEGESVLGSGKTDWDLTLSYGFGASIGITDRMTAELILDRSMISHQHTGLSGSANTNNWLTSWRFGTRYRFDK